MTDLASGPSVVSMRRPRGLAAEHRTTNAGTSAGWLTLLGSAGVSVSSATCLRWLSWRENILRLGSLSSPCNAFAKAKSPTLLAIGPSDTDVGIIPIAMWKTDQLNDAAGNLWWSISSDQCREGRDDGGTNRRIFQ